jgi:hypothetical protein
MKGLWIPPPSPLVDRIHDYPAICDPCGVEIVHERLRQHFRRRDVSCDIEHRDLEIATDAPLRALQYVGDHVLGRYLVEGSSGILHATLRQLRVQTPAHPVNITIEPGLDSTSAMLKQSGWSGTNAGGSTSWINMGQGSSRPRTSM